MTCGACMAKATRRSREQNKYLSREDINFVRAAWFQLFSGTARNFSDYLFRLANYLWNNIIVVSCWRIQKLFHSRKIHDNFINKMYESKRRAVEISCLSRSLILRADHRIEPTLAFRVSHACCKLHRIYALRWSFAFQWVSHSTGKRRRDDVPVDTLHH